MLNPIITPTLLALDEPLRQKILEHLSFKDHGQIACVSRDLRTTVASFQPAMAFLNALHLPKGRDPIGRYLSELAPTSFTLRHWKISIDKKPYFGLGQMFIVREAALKFDSVMRSFRHAHDQGQRLEISSCVASLGAARDLSVGLGMGHEFGQTTIGHIKSRTYLAMMAEAVRTSGQKSEADGLLHELLIDASDNMLNYQSPGYCETVGLLADRWAELARRTSNSEQRRAMALKAYLFAAREALLKPDSTLVALHEELGAKNYGLGVKSFPPPPKNESFPGLKDLRRLY